MAAACATGLVHVVEATECRLVIFEAQQTGTNQGDEPNNRIAAIHPLPVDGDAVAHDVRESAAGRKQMIHPRKGVLRFEHASFRAEDDPALKLVIYPSFAGEESYETLPSAVWMSAVRSALTFRMTSMPRVMSATAIDGAVPTLAICSGA